MSSFCDSLPPIEDCKISLPLHRDQNDLEVIRADIATLKDKIYLHDILGGVGYIFGIIGCFALWRSYRIKTPVTKNKE